MASKKRWQERTYYVGFFEGDPEVAIYWGCPELIVRLKRNHIDVTGKPGSSVRAVRLVEVKPNRGKKVKT